MFQPNLKFVTLGLLFIVAGCLAYYVGEAKLINSFIGFRIPPTFKDSETWRKVNIRGGLFVVLHGILMLVVGLVLPKIRFEVFLIILVYINYY